MQQGKKPLKFYLYMFLLSSMIVLAYSAYLILAGKNTIEELLPLWVLPAIFTLFYYGMDTVLNKLLKRKKKIDYEKLFLDAIAERMRNSKQFVIEDFRKLQKSERFQSQVKNAYEIYQNGEDEAHSLDRIVKKFREDTLEYRAIKYVVDFVKEKPKETDKK